MHNPSRKLQLVMDEVLGAENHVAGLKENAHILSEVKRGMDSMFGAALVQALNETEKYNMEQLVDLPAYRFLAIAQAKAEIMTARYIRSKLQAHVSNFDLLIEQIKIMENQHEQIE